MRTSLNLTSITKTNRRKSAVSLKMENALKKRELVAMLMESPFYFELLPRERLMLVQQHHRRFSLKAVAGPTSLAGKGSCGFASVTKADNVASIMVGFKAPRSSNFTGLR
jgi:hypothetical protein